MNHHQTRHTRLRCQDAALEVDHLLGYRGAEDIARALGYASPGCVARALYRAGRPDLARAFTATANARRAA